MIECRRRAIRRRRRTAGALVALIVLPLVVLVTSAYGRRDPLRARSLVAALRSGRTAAGAPGGQAAVVACGRVVWSGASGVLDLRSQRAVTARTLFVLASTTKTAVATMVMQLVQSGRLSLDAPLSRFYPKLPNAPEITVRMLLDMTSGLPEYLYIPQIRNIISSDPRYQWTRDAVLDDLGQAAFPPGTRFSYNDTNYIVLGGIIEQLTGAPLERTFQRRIARPAGMRASTFVPSAAGLRRMAHPFTHAAGGGLVDRWIDGYGLSADYWSPVWTDGGLAATAADLARFGDALFGGRLVRRATLAQMTHLGGNGYGFGVEGQSFDGHRWLGHEGGYAGFESEEWTDPARHVSIAVTTNVAQASGASTIASVQIWQAVARAYDRLRTGGCTA